MAAICSLVIFRDVKNGENELFRALGVSVFYFYFILFTAFRQGRRTVIQMPKQIFWTIRVKIYQA